MLTASGAACAAGVTITKLWPKRAHGRHGPYLTEPKRSAGTVLVADAWLPGNPSLQPLEAESDSLPSWLSSGDNAWQMTAATLVGLMSIPALAVLYGGIVQRKWAVNTMMMVFAAFALTLIVWVLWAFKMGFGHAWISTFVGKPGTVVGRRRQSRRRPAFRC